MLTISTLERWSTNYHIATAQAAGCAAEDLARPAQRRFTPRCFRLDGFSDLV
jgi:hypothetical protein